MIAGIVLVIIAAACFIYACFAYAKKRPTSINNVLHRRSLGKTKNEKST